MDIELLTIFMFGALVLLLVLGLPFAFATGGTAVIFLIYLWGPPALMLIVMRIWDLMGSFILVAVPMFIFMGAVLERSGIAAALYEAIYQWMGRLRGGLAMATVVVCAILAAMVGIVGAGVVTMGIIALPEMLKRRYHKGMPLGSICAGGALGYLIPPSILFIFYAMAAGVSVGALFAGGFLPGLLLVVLYIVYIGIRGYFQPDMAPAVPKEEMLPLKRRLILLKGVILPVLLICVVLGSIFTGIATPTEASGIGTMGALICAAVRRRLTWGMLKEVSYLTTGLTCMFMWGRIRGLCLCRRLHACRWCQILGRGDSWITIMSLGNTHSYADRSPHFGDVCRLDRYSYADHAYLRPYNRGAWLLSYMVRYPFLY
ncbi:TRAP transporter large permease subunit [Thermodesulfovibrionales bacterium]|nr:TRAP transporter large permease subunit [Thermodesulfovibrionales bacterium]